MSSENRAMPTGDASKARIPQCDAVLKPCDLHFFRSENYRSCRTKAPPNFSNLVSEFCSEFCSEFSPNAFRSFRASFRGKWRPEKNSPKISGVFNAECPGEFEEKVHKSFLESGPSNILTLKKGKRPHDARSLLMRCPRCGPQITGVSAIRVRDTSIREAPDTFNFLRHVMRAIWSVRPKCSHRCVSLKETPLKPVQILKHATKNSTEQTVMRTKWFKHIPI